MCTITFDVTPAMAVEIDRIRSIAHLKSRAEVFQRAFTLLRIHVEAVERGRIIESVDERCPDDRRTISLPFMP